MKYVLEPLTLPVVAQKSCPRGYGWFASHYGSSVPQRAEILRRIETERRGKVGALTVEVYRQDRRSTRSDRCLHLGDVDRSRHPFGIDKDDLSARVLYPNCSRDAAVGSGDHFIARRDADRLERDRDRVCAVGNTHGVRDATPLRKCLLERIELVAEEELPAREHAFGRCIKLDAQSRGVPREIAEPDGHQ